MGSDKKQNSKSSKTNANDNSNQSIPNGDKVEGKCKDMLLLIKLWNCYDKTILIENLRRKISLSRNVAI